MRKKRKLKKKYLIGLVVIIFLIIFVSLCLIIKGCLTLKLNGQDNIIVDVKNKYEEKGAIATILGNDISNKIKINGYVNTEKLGVYNITYKIKFLLFKKEKQRKVKVVDNKKPELILKGLEEASIYLNEDYVEDGYEVRDNYDNDLTSKVKVTSKVDNTKIGTYEIIYEVEDSSSNKTTKTRKVIVEEKNMNAKNDVTETSTKVGTYIKGILIVNKKYHLPANYNPGVDKTAKASLTELQEAANKAGFNIPLISGFRSYDTQKNLYNNYVARDGEEKANTYSAKPGQSEHQTGLAFDVGALDDNYGQTPAGKWLAENAYKYGFILRYPKGKEAITGYQYEPWHIRYVGNKDAAKIYEKGVTLEEYLNVVS